MEIQSAPPYEYLENDQSTWRRFDPPEVPKWVNEELVRIAGVNRHGQPNLRCVWAADMPSDRTEERQLKYSCGFSPAVVQGYSYRDGDKEVFTDNIDNVPADVMVVPSIKRQELGLPRFVIEQWLSPEELSREKRYRQRYAPGALTPTLRSFPRQGIYDLYLVIESAEGRFRKVDKDVIHFVKMKWNYDLKPFKEREQDKREIDRIEAKRRKDANEELWRAAASLDLKLDPEEKERRNHYWATLHDYEAEAERLKHRVSFYYANTGRLPA